MADSRIKKQKINLLTGRSLKEYKGKAGFQSRQVTPAGSFENIAKYAHCENIKNIHKKTCIKKLPVIFLMSVKETAGPTDHRYS